MKRLYQLLISALLFLIPSNLFYVLTETGSRVHGLRVDYLLPKLYASDFIILSLLALWLFEKRLHILSQLHALAKNKNYRVLITFFLVVTLLVRQLLAANPYIAVWTAVSFIKMALLTTVLWQKRALLHNASTYSALAATVLFQSIVGLWQFIMQRSLANYFFLGETNLSNFAGLAKTTLGGVERILPYGTTAHPNILGGFLAVSMLILFRFFRANFESKNNRRHHIKLVAIALIFGMLTLLATQSLSALTAFIVGIVLHFLPTKKVKIPVFLGTVGIVLTLAISIWLPFFDTQNTSIIRRKYLNEAGIHMIAAKPIFGVGLQNFTTQVEAYATTKEVVRFVQPAHNISVLFVAETGLLGVAIVLLLASQLKQKNNYMPWNMLPPLLPIALLDHYLLTQQTGLLLLLFWVLHFNSKKQNRPITY